MQARTIRGQRMTLGIEQVITTQTLMATFVGASLTLAVTSAGHHVERWRAARRPLIAPRQTTRPRRPPHKSASGSKPPAFRKVAPVKAAEILVLYMQDHNATGYHAAAEIKEWWRAASKDLNLALMSCDIVRSTVAEVPGVYAGLKRLSQPDFIEVKTRTKRKRCVIYRIPVDARSFAGDATSRPATSRKATGNRPANPKKRILSTAASVQSQFRGCPRSRICLRRQHEDGWSLCALAHCQGDDLRRGDDAKDDTVQGAREALRDGRALRT